MFLGGSQPEDWNEEFYRRYYGYAPVTPAPVPEEGPKKLYTTSRLHHMLQCSQCEALWCERQGKTCWSCGQKENSKKLGSCNCGFASETKSDVIAGSYTSFHEALHSPSETWEQDQEAQIPGSPYAT